MLTRRELIRRVLGLPLVAGLAAVVGRRRVKVTRLPPDKPDEWHLPPGTDYCEMLVSGPVMGDGGLMYRGYGNDGAWTALTRNELREYERKHGLS